MTGRAPSSPSLHLIAGGDTRQGKGHAQNEDNFWLPAADWPLRQTQNAPAPQQLAHKGYLYVVADGVGGHAKGNEASRIAVERIPAVYYQHPSQDIADSLTRAIRAANQQIYNQAQQPNHYGMSSTVAAAVIRGQELVTANLGDSRVYLLRNGSLQRLTADHTWIAEQEARGTLTPEEAASHPQRGVLTHALGISLEARPDIRAYAIAPGDRLLLCSDGVWGMIEAEIGAYLQNASPQQAATALVNRVAALGGADDATAIVVEVKRRNVSGMLTLKKSLLLMLALTLLCLFSFTVFKAGGQHLNNTASLTASKNKEATPALKTAPPALTTTAVPAKATQIMPAPLPTAFSTDTAIAAPPSSAPVYCVSPIKNPAFSYVQIFNAADCQIADKLSIGMIIQLPPDSVYEEYPCPGEAMLILIEYQNKSYRMYPWRVGRLKNGQCIPMAEWEWREFLKKPRDNNQKTTTD